MKKKTYNVVVLSVLALLVLTLKAQTIPKDSMYLGQLPPGNTPKVFNLPVTAGLRPVERIAISSDGKEIYYGELNTYPPTNQRIKYFKYSGNKWQGPFVAFDGFNSPGLSFDDKIIYLTKNINRVPAAYYSLKENNGWSTPVKLLSSKNRVHFVQKTMSGNLYQSSNSSAAPFNNEICKLAIANFDTLIERLEMPVNSPANEMDYFISKDESIMIISRYATEASDMYISFKLGNGGWTNPKKLGAQINTQNWEYGPVLSHDNMYLFFTRGGNNMDSYSIYWVKMDDMIDSLRHTNFTPYLNNQIANQSAGINRLFSYSIPENTFIDDDGNNTLTYSASLTNGDALPVWLTFNPAERTFTGTPKEAGIIVVKVTATDHSNAGTSYLFNVNVINSNGNEKPKNIL